MTGAQRSGGVVAFERQSLLSFFPTPVWIFDLKAADAGRINNDIVAWLDRLASPRPRSTNDLSLQTDHDFHNDPAFEQLRGFVMTAARGVLEFLQLDVDGEEITGCWLNSSPGGTRHADHTHPNNYLSGVYYVQTPPGAGNLAFYDPRPQAHVIAPPMKRGTPFTGSVMTVPVQAGRLVLFHSWLRHSVETNKGEGERISLAFNLMFRAFGERYGRPMWKPKIKPAQG